MKSRLRDRVNHIVIAAGVVGTLAGCSAPSGDQKPVGQPVPTGTAPASPQAAATPAEPRPTAEAVTPVPAPEGAVGAGPAAESAAKVPGANDATRPPAAGPLAPPSSAPGAVRASETSGAPPEPIFREITVPAGTVLPVELKTTVASDASQVEDAVRGSLRHGVTIKGVDVLPAGTVVTGHVTEAKRSGKVKGVARVAFRFTSLDLPGEGGRMRIQTGSIARDAEATKKKDVAKIGGGAAGGAIIGGILGGGSGAAKGATIGGAAGTGVVLATRGKEVTVPAGTSLSVRLTEPITVKVRQ